MRKFDPKYLYSAVAAAALTAAAIAIPAWGDSSEGESEQPPAQRAPLPMPPPEAREHLDELADCMRENGVDVPHASTKGGGFSIQLPPPEASSAMEQAAKECGLPAPPSRGHLMPLNGKEREQAQKAMKSLSQCMGSKGERLPVPPSLPPRN